MTKEQTNKALYIVAFFALCNFTMTVLMFDYMGRVFNGYGVYFDLAIFSLIQFLLIYAALVKQNKWLFLILTRSHAPAWERDKIE